MSTRVYLAGTALAVIAASLFPMTAYAERWVSGDDAGDVRGWHFDPEPEPCGTYEDVDASANTNQDVTRLVVAHRRKEVSLVVRFTDLDRKLEQHLSIHLVSGKRGWLLDVDRFRDFDADVFQVSGFLARARVLPDDQDECGDAVKIRPTDCHVRPRVELAADVVRVVVPRACLRHPRWVRAGVRATGHDEPDDHESVTAFSDVWGAEGHASSWLPPLGPKVTSPAGAGRATAPRPRSAH